jgi:hypothetical protein
MGENMNTQFDFLPQISLWEVKKQHVEIITQLHEAGYSYEKLASFFAIGTGAVLRHYISRKKIPRGDGTVLHQIHKQIMTDNSPCRAIIPPISIDKYVSTCAGQTSSLISYKRRGSSLPSENELIALSRIYHDVFQTDLQFSMSNILRVRGRYYAYRTSSVANVIVKSYLEIRTTDHNAFYADFIHYHPDRFYNPALTSEGRSLRMAPRQSNGLAFHLGINIYMIGNIESGQGVDMFALRDPMNKDFFSLSGFNLATNLDRIIFSTRTILIKNSNATEKGIGRINVDDFDEKKEGFDLQLLENKFDGYTCDNVSRMRMF